MGESKRRQSAGRARSEGHDREIGDLLDNARQLHVANRLREAHACYERVFRLDPMRPDAWHGAGRLARQTGQADAAIKLLARAVGLAPAAAEVRLDYAFALQDAGQFEAAAAEAQEACRLQPDFARAWETLGILQQALGETAAAEIAYRKANALAPTIGRRVKLATLISPIMASREAIVAERERMASAIDAVPADADATHNDPMREALWSNFYLAYHALDDRDLQTRTAAMYRRLFPSLEHVAAHCREPRQTGGKIRVGLASQFFHNHSIGRTSRGFFAELSRDAFDVVAIFIEPRVDDDLSGFIRGHAARSIDVPRDLALARRLIEAERLDVLFYPDIGMEPFSYFLAFSRLAPVQCVTYGHPDTTGIPAIDYFISNDLYEPPGAQAHYSERLFLLRDLPTLAYYYRPERQVPRKGRGYFGLSDDDPVYVCPQSLFKFHPDMDDLIAGILSRDARARVVVIAGRVAHWTALIRKRWAASLGDAMDRIVVLPRMSGQDYVDLIEVSDVMLDTRHFNGMNTSLEALAVGTPVVTWPGEYQRGRHTQAMYRRMGWMDCVVDNAESYVDLAVRLANDRGFRATVRARILDTNGALFEDARVVREFERFFRESLAHPR